MGWLDKLLGKKEKAMEGKANMPMGSHQAPAGVKTAKDPVCGMQVNPDKAAGTSAYQGQTYYFCAVGCKKAFDKEPEKYLKGASGHSH